jgi:hypothetical protein
MEIITSQGGLNLHERQSRRSMALPTKDVDPTRGDSSRVLALATQSKNRNSVPQLDKLHGDPVPNKPIATRGQEVATPPKTTMGQSGSPTSSY